jgi:hypothetical protein
MAVVGQAELRKTCRTLAGQKVTLDDIAITANSAESAITKLK